MDIQELTPRKEKIVVQSLTPEELEHPEKLERPEESSSTADGITVINDTGFEVSVLVSNQILGIASSGYIKPNNELVLPAGWAWWDVYILFHNQGSHLFLQGYNVWSHKKQNNVGYRATLKVSEMT